MSVPKRLRKKSRLEVFRDSADLAEYVLKITSNEKVFKPEHRVVTEKIISATLDASRFIWCANEIRIRKDDPELCRLYKSDAADERHSVDPGCRTIYETKILDR